MESKVETWLNKCMKHTLCPHMLRGTVIASLLALSVPVALATCYQVDFAAGDDAKNGLTPDTAFKHSPGDTAATGLAAAVKLLPGDSVRFKGGVVYRGSVAVKVSGEAGKPIVFDGNTDGTWGTGRAVVDGGDQITGWKRCTSVAEAKGNPKWAEIFYVDLPKPKSYSAMNLSDSTTALPISQQPKPKDPFWQEDPNDYFLSPNVIKPVGGLRVAADPGAQQNGDLPISNLLTGHQAVICPVPGGGFTYTLAGTQTIVAVALALQPGYPALKEVMVLGDGKELMHLNLEKNNKEKLQRFELPTPATITTLGFQFRTMYEGEKDNWSKLNTVAAYTKDGANLLKGSDAMTFTDPERFTQADAHWYDGMTFAFHGGPNMVVYVPVTGYDPASKTLHLAMFGDAQYKKTKYCLFNSVHLIDQPGEYSVEDTADTKLSRVFLLPPAVKDGQPVDISVSVRAVGFVVEGACNITVQGFIVRRQNKSALSASGPACGIIFRDCETTLVRGGAVISGSKIKAMTVENCQVHDNPGHTRGVVLHTCTDSMVRGCRLVKNSATGLDYYGTCDSQVIGNTVLENYGMHANGLTFYVGCRNILVEGNRVAKGNVSLTFEDSNDLIFRNNLFDGSGKCMVVGLWSGPTIRNVQFLNNTIVRSDRKSEWSVGLFTNCKAVENLVVRNNIIDGVGDDHHGVFAKGGVFSHNLYTRVNDQLQDPKLGTDSLNELDLKKIFVDPEHDDFRLCPGSPAIGAGTEVGVATDIEGKTRPTTGKPDIGAWAYGK